MVGTTHDAMFETIYATDLVYEPGCWQRCGDAHCCSFARYKSQMTMLGRQTRQELPLLPGEYEYLSRTGRLHLMPARERRTVSYALARGTMSIDLLVGRDGGCGCEHASRTAVCRLYPLLPVYDVEGRVVDVDPNFGSFEEIEAVDGAARACRVTALPFAETGKFLTIANAIGREPVALFYAMAYRLAKRHARASLERARAASGGKVPAVRLFEGMFLLRQLLDHDALRAELDALAAQFAGRYGGRFALPGEPA